MTDFEICPVGTLARLAEQNIQLKSYDVLRRAVNESTNECGPDCDDHGHADGCPALSPSSWLEDQQREIDGLEARLAEAERLLKRADPLEHCATSCDYCTAVSAEIDAFLRSADSALCLARSVGTDEPLPRCADYPRCICGGPADSAPAATSPAP